ncbi:Crp/Fnr family transcriptional regulator [Flavobacterium sp. ov086]|uniref:Crp/Fnr family transcriptional regulator n=1 Tax=Flavobacterium sp. ov086 TaxID=1761785 RepID=UPI000B6E0775|nr:Crp/Fnr family transcriptional regulator [Flavobacterium sp. ov086]SNR76290.1 cAMP-binding domain of CRP or a regulatory subunit of cAMP-dependent protein kinases [Flavobacterium sp. ov086]
MEDNTAATDTLINYFNTFFALTAEEKELVVSSFQLRRYRKHQYVLQEGNNCQHFNFVLQGCLRMYQIDTRGNIHILQFAIEQWWVNDLHSFHKNIASNLNIDALEDTQILQITYQNLIDLYEKAPRFNQIFRVLTENAYIGIQKRLLLNISSTAEERYIHFATTYPYLLNRISQVQIAGYLGVTPEFLSRLRKKTIK